MEVEGSADAPAPADGAKVADADDAAAPMAVDTSEETGDETADAAVGGSERERMTSTLSMAAELMPTGATLATAKVLLLLLLCCCCCRCCCCCWWWWWWVYCGRRLPCRATTFLIWQVRVEVPHLIRGTLREYQHVALDWLVSMYEKNLNGKILYRINK